LHAGRPRPWPHCVRWGPRSPSPKGAHPQFSAHICYGQMARCSKMPLGRKVGLDRSDIVLDGNPAHPSPKREQTRQFLAHISCAQTAGWINMPLGMEVGLDPSDIVLDEDPQFSISVVAKWLDGSRCHWPPPQQWGQSPNFRSISVMAKWLDGPRCHLVWK